MRRISPIVTSVIALASARPALAQQQEPSAPLLFGVRASWMPARDVDGQIDYFKGTTPTSTYHERDAGGVALGGDVGFHVFRVYELHLGADTRGRTAQREGAQVHQRETTIDAELRIVPLGGDRLTIPYVALGASAFYAREDHDPSVAAPWPGTTAMWGTSPVVAVGAQRRLGQRAALDVALALAGAHVARVELDPGNVHDIGAGHSFVPQIRVGLAWLPSRGEMHRAATDQRPLAVERSVRLYTADGLTRSGSVVSVTSDTVVLQTRTTSGWNQVHVPRACITAIDVESGSRGMLHSTLASAVQSAVVVGSALLLARGAGWGVARRIPEEPGRFAASALVPGAIAGGAFGLLRERSRWVRAPLPGESKAGRPAGSGHC